MRQLVSLIETSHVYYLERGPEELDSVSERDVEERMLKARQRKQKPRR